MKDPFPLLDVQIIGSTPAIKELARQIDTAANCRSTVLVTGETGTGKELVARAIHRRSRRHQKPFIAVNCAAFTEDLLEAELFGHVRGSFTGALTDRKGLVAAAAGGTLFLDEIGEMSPALQKKLLRVLQERAVRPIGGHQELAVEVRVIAATNRDLRAEVAAGRFREDLLYRLTVLEMEITPLRERREDVGHLAAKFLEGSLAKLDDPPALILEDEALQALQNFSWPGNVRQLENLVERLVDEAAHDGCGTITARHVGRSLARVPASTSGHRSTAASGGAGAIAVCVEDAPATGHVNLPATVQVILPGETYHDYIERVSREALVATINLFGNYSDAARRLGVNRSYAYKKVPRQNLVV